MTYTICYVSKAIETMGQLSIEDIFLTTLQKNTRNNIHGILLFGMGNFFQVLEGKEKDVEALYENHIKKDPRHSEIFEVIRRRTEKPIFSEYSSLFTVVKTNQQLEQIKAYLALNRVNSTSEKLSRLLNPFLLDT